MVEIETQDIDRKIKELKNEKKILETKTTYMDDILPGPYGKNKEAEHIRKIERIEDQILKREEIKALKSKAIPGVSGIQELKL
jgi:hypothetical protein